MKTKLLNFFLMLILTNNSLSQISSECFMYFQNEMIFYNSKGLLSSKDDSISAVVIIDGVEIEGSIKFNFCTSLNLPKICERGFKNSLMYFITEDQSLCVNLLSSHSSQNTYRYLYSDSLKDKTNGYQIIKTKPEFAIELICSKDIDAPVSTVKNNVFESKSKHFCGKVAEMARIYEKFRIPISVFMFLTGFILMLYGYFKKYILQRVLLFMTSLVSCFWLFTSMIDYPPNSWVYALVTIGCFLVSFIFIVYKIRNEWFPNLILGSITGAIYTKLIFMMLEVTSRSVSS